MQQTHYIKEYLLLKGLTMTDLAEKLGVTRQAVAQYMTHDIRVSRAKNIADALGISLAELFINPDGALSPCKNNTESNSLRCPKCSAELHIEIRSK